MNGLQEHFLQQTAEGPVLLGCVAGRRSKWMEKNLSDLQESVQTGNSCGLSCPMQLPKMPREAPFSI